MGAQLLVVVIPAIFLILASLLYLSVKLASRRLKRSKYGHTFDFSQIPKQKISSSKKAG